MLRDLSLPYYIPKMIYYEFRNCVWNEGLVRNSMDNLFGFGKGGG